MHEIKNIKKQIIIQEQRNNKSSKIVYRAKVARTDKLFTILKKYAYQNSEGKKVIDLSKIEELIKKVESTVVFSS